MTTAISYVRVSSAEQAKGYSLSTQEASCARYCEERGYDLLACFTDVHTGTELDRPGLDAAIDAAKILKPAVVVLHDVDRLGREMIVQAIAERELTRHGARIAYVLGGDTDTGDGILLKGVKQALAAYENYQRVERSRRGKNGRVQAGSPLVGPRPPYGYRYVAGERTGTLEPHPDESLIVQQMYHWCAAERLSCYAIAKRLNAEGVPTRADTNPTVVAKQLGTNVWRPDTIGKILRSETHKGCWHWGKTRKTAATTTHLPSGAKRKHQRVQVTRPREEWRTVSVPPLVDDARWDAAQRQLDHNQAESHGNAKRDYLLRGKVLCGHCGRRWGGRGLAPPHRAYYRCARGEGQAWRNTCPVRFGIEQTRLEGAVLDALRTFLLDPEVRATGIRAEADRVGVERERAAADLAAADQAITALDAKYGKLVDDILMDAIPAEVVAKKKREVLAERERRLRERERALLDLSRSDRPDVGAALDALVPIVEAAFAAASASELRQLLDLLRVEVHVIDRDTVRLAGVVGGADGAILPLSRA